MLSAIVVLLAVSKALSYNPIEVGTGGHRPEILLAKWTSRDIYTLEKICQIAQVAKYGQNPFQNTFENVEYENVFLNNLATRKTLREIEHCCNKYTVTEKKQCMKDVRENFLDNYCDKGLDHTCCKIEYENRYTCFAKNPFRRVSHVSPLEFAEQIYIPQTRRMQNERQLLKELAVDNLENQVAQNLAEEENRYSYLEKLEDIRGVYRQPENILSEEIYENEREGRRWARDVEENNIAEAFEIGAQSAFYEKAAIVGGPADWETLETLNEVGRRCNTPNCNLESKAQLENEIYREKMIEGERPCHESHQCRRRLEYATKAAAEQVCSNKLNKGGRHQINQCCRAGALVGKMVGRKNENVCPPALFKFQQKTLGCVNRPECKQAFVQCCHERAERSREQRVVEKDYLRERNIEKDLLREEFIEQPGYEQRRYFY